MARAFVDSSLHPRGQLRLTGFREVTDHARREIPTGRRAGATDDRASRALRPPERPGTRYFDTAAGTTAGFAAGDAGAFFASQRSISRTES